MIKIFTSFGLCLLFSQFAAAQNWTQQVSGTTGYLSEVTFINDSVGWVVGNGGTILHTTSGGTTWSPQTSGTSEWLRGIYMFNAMKGWVVGHNGVILYTYNGGANWELYNAGTNEEFRDVYFIDENVGWITGVNAIILGTTNAGLYWTDVTQINNDELATIWFTDAANGWAAGYDGLIIHSTNGGSDWDTQTDGVYPWVQSLYFFDALTGWAVCSYGEIIKTTNGGTDWGNVTSGVSGDLYDICFADLLHATSVGASGIIISSVDGGNNWSAEVSGVSSYLYSVHVNPGGEAWAVGMGGTIIHRDASDCPAVTFDQTFEICQGDSLQVGNIWYDQPGEYATILQSSLGCDSIVTTNLIVNFIDTVITQAANTLSATTAANSYQWINCETNQPISGATNAMYSVVANGSYAVEMTYGNGCSVTSPCAVVSVNGIGEIYQPVISVHPDFLPGSVRFNFSNANGILTIANTLGQTLQNININQSSVVVTDLQFGFYTYLFRSCYGSIYNDKFFISR